MKLSIFLLLLLLLKFSMAQVPGMKWLHEPKHWSSTRGTVSVTAESKTDFWRITHYGYTTDNGHFYYAERSGNFIASVKITGQFKELYDQAGLMIRLDSTEWIKSGVEFADDRFNISAVYTRAFSDWSVITLAKAPLSVWLKLKREKDAVELSYSLNGIDFQMQRLGYFSPGVKAQIGIMTAAPEGRGFKVTFEDFTITPLP
jgi:uncharacterized protein